MRSLDVFVCVRNIFPQHRRQQSVVHTLHYHHHPNRGVRVVGSAFPGKSVKGASPTLRIIGLGSGFPPSGPHDSRGADSRESPSGLGNGFTHQQKKKKRIPSVVHHRRASRHVAGLSPLASRRPGWSWEDSECLCLSGCSEW